MGALGGYLGLSGGANGTGFAGPAQASIANPVGAGQLNNAYTGTQNSLQSQQDLLGALQGQQGIQNQNQVYGQLQGVVNGTGPNPAQAMLNQQTGQNVANQAALMAGQRGASSNVGLIARQAAQQGAATQQQAVGQGATLQANQSLNALGQAGNMAGTQVANQIGQTNANTSAQLEEQQGLLGAQQAYNAAQVSSQGNINSANAGLAGGAMQGQQGIIGGLMNAAGPAAAAAAEGGEILKMAMAGGGNVDLSDIGELSTPQITSGVGPQSKFGQFLTSNLAQPVAVQDTAVNMPQNTAGTQKLKSGMSKLGGMGLSSLKGSSGSDASMAGGPMDGGGMAGAGELMAANGGMAHDYRNGGKVNAKNLKEKAIAPGNNYANDKIPAILSEHEIVLPRSVTMSQDPVKASAKFVANQIAKRKMKGGR